MSVFHDIGREAAILINVNQKSAMTKAALSPQRIAQVLRKAAPGAARRVQAIVQRMGGDKAIANSAKSMQAIAKPGYGNALALRNARQATDALQRQYSPGAISPSRVLSEAAQAKNIRNLQRPINQSSFAVAPAAGARPRVSVSGHSGGSSPAAAPGEAWASAARSSGYTPTPSPAAVPGANWASAAGGRSHATMSGHGGGSSPAAAVGASSAAPVPSPAAAVGAASATPATAPAPGVGLGQTIGKGVDQMFSGGGSLLGKALKLPFTPGMPLERRFLTAGGLGVAGAGINDALAYAADKTGLPIPHMGEWDPSRVKGLAKQEPWTTGLMHPLQYLASKNAPDAAPFRPAGPKGQLPSGLEFKNPMFDPTTGQWTATPSGRINMEASPEVSQAQAQYQQSKDLLQQYGIPTPGPRTTPQQPPAIPNMDHYRWSPPSYYSSPNRMLINNVY